MSRSGWQVPALAVVVLAAGLWAYMPAFAGVFVLDDIRGVARNATIQQLWPLTVPLSPPPESTVSGRPIANLSFAVNRALVPAEATTWGYHAGNLLIHLAAALVLFGVVRRTLESEPLRAAFASSARAIAFATALTWAVHPLNTEAVTYIVQRVESLMALFFLLTLYCAIRAADVPAASGPVMSDRAAKGTSRRSRWLGASILSCALGMGTKEVMIGAPLAVLAWDWLFLPSRRPRWALLGSLAATWGVLALLVFNERRAPSVELGAAVAWRYLLTQSAVIAHYLRLAIVPAPLVFLYTWPLAGSIGDVVLPAALIVLLLALTIAGLFRRHPAAFPGAMFFLVLAPTSSVLPIVTEVAAEHRMYLPLAALLALAMSCLALLARRVGLPGRSVAAVAIVLAIVLGLQTRARNAVYASDEALWGDTVNSQPGNQRARVAYGTALAMRRKVAEAEAQFQAAVDLNEADPIAQARLGSAQAAQGKLDAAVPHLERALALRPDDVEAHRALGQIYAIRQDDARALTHLMRAADAFQDDAGLITRIAALLAGSRDPMVRDPRRALTFAERAVALTARKDPVALDILSAALAGAGRLAEAAAAAREALPLAAAQGNQPLVTELEQRARAYGAR